MKKEQYKTIGAILIIFLTVAVVVIIRNTEFGEYLAGEAYRYTIEPFKKISISQETLKKPTTTITRAKKYLCSDSDNGADFLTKGTVNSLKYPSGKEDYCYTFPNGINYLMEGICDNNEYAYVQKNCAELGENYVCDNGKCDLATTHNLYLEDSLSIANGYTLRLVKIFDDSNSGKGAVFTLFKELENGNLEHHPLSPVNIALYNQYHLAPYIKRNGLMKNVYFALENVDFANNKIIIKEFNSCYDLVQYCLANPLSNENNDYCYYYCPYESLEGEVSYSTEHFVGYAPSEFQELNEYIINSFELCYNKIKDYTLLEPVEEKIYFHIFIGESLSGFMGARYDSIVLSTYDENGLLEHQQRITQKIGGYGEFANNLEAGICPTDSAQGHELTHVFLAGTPIGIGYCVQGQAEVCAAFNEGLAEYLKYKVNDYYMEVDSYQQILCSEEGISYSWAPELIEDYYNFSSGEDSGILAYNTGLCIWDYIEKTYGHDVFLQIMNALDEHRNVHAEQYGTYINHAGIVQSYNYNIINDFIVPFTGEEIIPILEERFGLPINNAYVSIPSLKEKWYFSDWYD